MICPYLSHKNSFQWDKANEFNPDRKEFDNDDLRFLPFSSGRRSCIGQFFALMEAKIAIIKILLEFNIKCDTNCEDRLLILLTLVAEGGVTAKISTR
mmetsp:Transcript_61927/g.71022  ORF Transcript_61927/g.71022 Transcript_61927/m.71022 type:complete len:97 (+) Transcript_61927:2-292(+)